MFDELFQKGEFYNRYMLLFAARFAFGNLEMENISNDPMGFIQEKELTSPIKVQEFYNNMTAFMNLIDENKERLSPYDIADVADQINQNLTFLPKGFRRTQVEVKKAQHFFPRPAREVIPAMYSLCNSYHNIWNVLPPFEKEARFHIEMVRLQPFEDGNKRTARIIMNYHLCKQRKAPIVIPGSENEKYFSFIDNYDVDGFTDYIKEKSKEELNAMLQLYHTICEKEFPDEKEKHESDEDVKIYVIHKKNDKKK